ncbi:hypothetical protein DB88DRAFT_543797 [Papiliotrema laurentii]|uniref:Chromo domain-containing protein n=1 Tax=Papiliotrema laurentii TaxID=5418 RepID=A0AAD9FWD4_PAPLA|nr:hypothetical protein DB88DRAFT_543797 [Papiliotrema laurentii]
MVGASRSKSKSKSQSVEVIEPTSMEVDGEQQEANGNGLNDAQEEGEEEQDDDLPAGDDKGVEAGEDDDEEEEEEGEFEVEAIVDHRAGDAAVGCVREPKAKMGLTRSSFRYPKSYLFALLPDACDKSMVRRANTNVGDYLVSWKGYGPDHNTWEPEAHLSRFDLLARTPQEINQG